MNPVLLFLLFLKASFLSFGGLASLPILHQDLVARNLPDVDKLFGQALAVGRLSPGPNGLYLVSAGYQLGGFPGAAAAAVALLIPPFSILAIMAYYVRVAHLERTKSGMLMLSLAVTGLLGYTSWEIVAGSAGNLFEWLAGGAGFLAAARTRLHPLVLIAAAAAVGILIYR